MATERSPVGPRPRAATGTDEVVTLGLDRLVVDRLTAGASPVQPPVDPSPAAFGSGARSSPCDEG